MLTFGLNPVQSSSLGYNTGTAVPVRSDGGVLAAEMANPIPTSRPTNTGLSFPGVPEVAPRTSVPVSYGSSVPAADPFGTIGNFLNTFSLGTSTRNHVPVPESANRVYQEYAASRGAAPISDGSTGFVGSLIDSAQDIFEAMGVQTEMSPQPVAFVDQSGEMNWPLIIGAVVLAGGAIYLATSS